MSARLRGIARETQEIVAAGGYRMSDGRAVSLMDAIEAARAGTRTLGPGPVEAPKSPPADPSAPPTNTLDTDTDTARAEPVVEVFRSSRSVRAGDGAPG